jgi:ribokinase
VTVNSNGENYIAVYPGANGMVDKAYIDNNWTSISNRDIFLLQLEIPFDTTFYTIQRLKQLGKVTIFDPAPARELPDDLLSMIDYITPNETELQTISGIRVETEDDIRKAADALHSRGANTVIAKAGKRGAFISDRVRFAHIKGYTVDAVDPTAAGDSFNAALAFSLAQNQNLDESVSFANAVAGLSTTAVVREEKRLLIRRKSGIRRKIKWKTKQKTRRKTQTE